MPDPLIAIIGSAKTPEAATAAEDLGRELAKAGFRILVYASGADYLETPVVRGYVASEAARNRGIEVRYPLRGQKPAFPEQTTHANLFDFRPDHSADWEISFYRSLNDVDGALLLGGGSSTLVAGLVAMGNHVPIVAIASFDGSAGKVWQALQPGRDLPTGDEISLMARPAWSAQLAAECVDALRNQLARRTEEARQRRLAQLRSETLVTWHAVFALVLFVLSVLCVPFALVADIAKGTVVSLLFIAPLLAGVAGSTIRLVFDLRQGNLPLNRQSAITTAALGLIAGGAAGLLFVTTQMATLPPDTTSGPMLSKLVPFGVIIGFIGGLTLDAVFRKMIAADVADLSAVEAKKRS